MAVVRKYGSGGITEDPATLAAEYEQFLAKKIQEEENKFTAKVFPSIQQQAAQWRDGSYKGLLNAYERDPITNTYTVRTDKLPEELRKINWAGNKEEVKLNLLGQYSKRGNRDSEDAEFGNSVISNWTNEFLNSRTQTKSTTIPVSNHKKASIKPLGDFVLQNKFHGVDRAFQDASKRITDEKAMKRQIMSWGIENLNLYDKTMSEDTKGEWDFEKINPTVVEGMKKAFEDDNYDDFVKYSSELGWTPDDLLKIKQKTTEDEEVQKDSLPEYVKTMNAAGIYDETFINDMYAKKFKLDSSNTLPGAFEGFSDWLSKNKALLFKNDYNQYAIIQGGKPMDYSFEDPDAPGFGTYFTHNNGILDFRAKGMDTWDGSKFEDKLGSIYGKKNIEGTAKGYEGWSIEGYPTLKGSTYLTDSLGNRDYTSHLMLRSPKKADGSSDMIEIFKDANGNYKTIDGNLKVDVNIAKYGESTPVDYAGSIEGDSFAKLGTKKYFEDFSEAEKLVGKVFAEQAGKDDIEPLKQVIADLRYKIVNGQTITEKETALKYYSKLINENPNFEMLPVEIKERLLAEKASDFWRTFGNIAIKNFPLPAPGLPDIFKTGGKIRKGASGLSFDEYIAKHGKPAEKAKVTKAGPVKSKIGTFKDWGLDTETALDVASLVGTGISFIPGIGVIGGGVMTAADLLKDAIDGDGKINWGTHAANLGFTALAGVGLGGLKGINAALKVGKIGDKVFDLKNVISKVDEIAEVGNMEALKTSVKNIKNLEGKLGSKGAETVLKKLADGKTKLTKTEETVLKEIFNPTKGKKAIGFATQKATLLKDFEAVENVHKSVTSSSKTGLIEKLAKSKVPSYAKNIMGAGAIASALPAASEVAKSAVKGEWDDIKVDDVQKVGMAASLGKQWARSAKNTKIFNKYTKPTSESPGHVKLIGGEKPIDFEKKIKLPSEGKLGIGKKKITENFKSELKKKGLTDDQIEELMKKDLSWDIKKASSSATRELDPERLTKPDASIREYKRVKEILEGNIKYKKGGILKFQKPAGALPHPGSAYMSVNFFPKPKVKRKISSSGMSPYNNLPTPWSPISTEMNPIPYIATDPAEIAHKEAIAKLKSVDWAKMVEKETTPTVSTKAVTGEWVGPEEFKPGTNTTEEYIKSFWPTSTTTGTSTGSKGNFAIANQRPKWGQKLTFEDVANTIMYLNTLRANTKSAQAQKRALAESMTNTPMLSRTYVRVNSPYSPAYEKYAAKLNSTGKNLQESVADLDKGFGARLSAVAQANELREKGIQADTQSIQQGIERQIGLNADTDAKNVGIRTQNILRNADAASKMHLVDANLPIANNNAFNNYVAALHKTRESEELRGRYKNMFDAITDPKMRDIQTQRIDLVEKMKQGKIDWEKQKSDPLHTGAKEDIGTWEESDSYKALKSEEERLSKIMEDYKYKMFVAQTAAQFPIMKKGGSLEEKEYLLKLRHKQARDLIEEKEFYKRILANNEIMRKSLLKIFK